MILLQAKLRQTRNKFFSLRFHSRFKGAVVGLFLLTYLLGGYLLLKEGFQFLQNFPFVGALLLDRIVELFFFSLFCMLVLSHTLFAYAAYFRSKETDYLRTLPLSPRSLFAWEFWEATFLSSWTFVFIAMPMLVAYAEVRGIFFSFVGLFFVVFVPMVLIAAVFGTLLTFVCVRLYRSSARWAWVLALLLGAATVAIGLAYLRTPATMAPAMNQMLDKLLWHTRFAQWPLWPSQWVARAMFGFLHGEFFGGLSYLWLLCINAAFLVQGLLFLGGSVLEASMGWEMPRRRKARRYARLAGLQRATEWIFGRGHGRVIVKDIKSFLRDPAQWSHFAIFFGLLAIYFLNLRNFRYEAMGPYWKNLVTFLNLATIGLVGGTLATRFFFPLPSMEIRRRWIWGVRSPGFVLWPKFLAGFLFLLAITEGLMLLSCRMLQLDDWMTHLCLLAQFFISMTMMGLSLGLGAAFPVPDQDSSAKIVSGFGGTLCLVLCLGYLGVVVVAIGVPIHWFVIQRAMAGPDFAKTMAYVTVSVVGLSVLLATAALMMGARTLRQTEY